LSSSTHSPTSIYYINSVVLVRLSSISSHQGVRVRSPFHVSASRVQSFAPSFPTPTITLDWHQMFTFNNGSLYFQINLSPKATVSPSVSHTRLHIDSYTLYCPHSTAFFLFKTINLQCLHHLFKPSVLISVT
jgi:hypothetical protein